RSGRRLQMAAAGGAQWPCRCRARPPEGRVAGRRAGSQARRGPGSALPADHRALAVTAATAVLPAAVPARPGRPEITLAGCPGACRMMRRAGYSVLVEMPLPGGRRADIFAVGRGGEIVIVEVKSSIEDWRVDGKWPDYLGWCDLLYVAVPIDFPQALIPAEIG